MPSYGINNITTQPTWGNYGLTNASYLNDGVRSINSAYNGSNPWISSTNFNTNIGGTALSNATANQGALAGIKNWWGQYGDTLGQIGGTLAGAVGLYSGLMDINRNKKTFKSNMESLDLQRQIARENLAMQQAEYNRLKRNRAAVTAAYGA